MEVKSLTEPNKSVTRIKSAYMNQYDAQKERVHRRKRKLLNRLIIIGLAFMVAFGVMITYHVKQRVQQAELQKEYDTLTEQIAGLEKDERAFQEEINLLNDDEYILDIARTNYFLSKKGELIIQIEDHNERTY